ncbi:MAG TPA: DUF2262 domain-containing protein [Longimicrobium sp.]|nr:DUF2262 domain-containing protein [Longimicrobium sp.]
MKRLRGLLSFLSGSSPASGPTAPARREPGGEVVTGIVHPFGASGTKDLRTREWSLRFRFEEWRGADGVIRRTELMVSGRCTPAEVHPAMDRINAAQVISARVRFTGADSAEFLELVDTDVTPGDPLVQRAIELARPVLHDDPQFGTLTLRRGSASWEGMATWGGDTVELSLDAELEDALRTARALWSDQAGWSERVEAFAVQDLLPAKNENWLDDDEQPVEPDDFRARMRLEAVHVHGGGGFTFSYDDGGLFWGHTLEVSGTLEHGPDETSVQG